MKTKITAEDVDAFIKEIKPFKVGDKTTVVQVILANGFELIESSACVDPANYDEDLGIHFAMEKIKDKVWFLLGFLLQNKLSGYELNN
jgi:hypothetical protein